MRKTLSLLATGALLFGGAPVHAANIMMDLLDRFSVIAGDYTAGNETEGSAFVYGAYTAGGGAQFGFNGGQVANDSENVLWLNNGVSNGSSTTLITGSLISRTPVNASQFNLNGNAAGTPSITTGESSWNNALAGVGLTSTNHLTGMLALASQQWSKIAKNSEAFLPNNGSLTFDARPALIDNHMVAVFSISGALLSNAGAGFDRLEINFNGAETVLINVSGADVTVQKNFTNGFTNNESKILFNFYEATSLNLNSNFRGGVFAPLANVAQNGSNIDGTVVARGLTQSAEIHDERFDGHLPFVPEPSTALLALGGLGLALRRRR